MDEPLDQVTAKQLILRILESGTLSTTRHVLERMEERDLDMTDCVNVLRGGIVDEIDHINGSWRYRVATPKMAFVVAFNGDDRLVVVTAIRRDR